MIVEQIVEVWRRRGLKIIADKSKVMVLSGKERLECEIHLDWAQLECEIHLEWA